MLMQTYFRIELWLLIKQAAFFSSYDEILSKKAVSSQAQSLTSPPNSFPGSWGKQFIKRVTASVSCFQSSENSSSVSTMKSASISIEHHVRNVRYYVSRVLIQITLADITISQQNIFFYYAHFHEKHSKKCHFAFLFIFPCSKSHQLDFMYFFFFFYCFRLLFNFKSVCRLL